MKAGLFFVKRCYPNKARRQGKRRSIDCLGASESRTTRPESGIHRDCNGC